MIRVDTATRILKLGDQSYPCVIGKGGAIRANDKREGDGCTPLGRWPIRGALLRRDRTTLAATPLIPWRWIGSQDGWSDAPDDPAYNRPVCLPHRCSHERLWRDDRAYDIVIVLGHNDNPPVPGRGSAIFFHIWVLDDAEQPKPTEECVAVSPHDMQAILPQLRPDDIMDII